MYAVQGKNETVKKRGPKPNHLQLGEENWENAVKKAVQKKKPEKEQKTQKSD